MDFRPWFSTDSQILESLSTATLKDPEPPKDINPSELFGEYGSFDISRMPPRMFLQITEARQAIRDEIRGLLRKDKSGIPVGEVITSDNQDFSRLEKLHTTMACKVKLQKGFNARLCLRGDQQSLINSGFASAPTASRDFLRWVVILGVGSKDFKIGMADVSQAFLRSSYLRKTERVIAMVPPYVKFSTGSNDDVTWKGFVSVNHSAEVFEGGNRKKCHKGTIEDGKTYGIKLFRPLYGSRDAPLRWFFDYKSNPKNIGICSV